MTTLMRNGRDRRSENPLRATRGKNACFCLGPISGSHQGPQPERLHSEAEYMAAPERFAKRSESSLAPRAPSIHGTKGACNHVPVTAAYEGTADETVVGLPLQSIPNRDPPWISAVVRYRRLEKLRLGLTFWRCVGNARWTRALRGPRAHGPLLNRRFHSRCGEPLSVVRIRRRTSWG